MITFCESPSDEHAPFPHRLITITMSRLVRDPITWKLVKVPVSDQPVTVFVICANCDHWINRPSGSCDCYLDCHRIVTEPRRRSGKTG